MMHWDEGSDAAIEAVRLKPDFRWRRTI